MVEQMAKNYATLNKEELISKSGICIELEVGKVYVRVYRTEVLL